MRKIVFTPRFKRSFRKFVKRNSQLEQKILQTIKLMQEDILATSLSTHSLQGKLLGLKACSCGYDCRIVFSLEIDKNTTEEVIILIDLGTHDMVY
ncbi:MAG: type II toxin-antitoxin system mRNA interferase toxin, RelE/StbE family [Okeania sp. SIO3C4]|nr:type II toxin-antitoxin system mRNA interferase toxin, RelE/StbE family [Okeania sp. SIO3C4]